MFISSLLQEKAMVRWLIVVNIYVVGNKCTEQSNSCLNISQQSAALKEEPSTPQFVLAVPYVSANETNGQVVVTGTNLRPAPPLVKQFHGNLHNGVESSGDTQIRNARPRADARGRSPLLPRYWPRFTDQELQQMSGEYPLISYLVYLFFN